MSHPPRSNRGHRDQNGDYRERSRDYREAEREHRQQQSGDHRGRNGEHRRSSPDSSSSRPPYYPPESESESEYTHRHVRDVRQHRAQSQSESKCSNICSRRGIVLICSVLTNALVLICVVAAQMVMSGLSSRGGMSGFDINSNFALQGTELQRARELDMQFSQMRAPGVYGGVAFSLTLGVLSLVFVVAGSKPPQLTSRRLLTGALAFQAAGALAYVAAVGLYLHFVVQVNSTDVCSERERIYARSGYTWMNCSVGGADAAVALFGLITAVLYAAGATFTAQTLRRVRRQQREAAKQQQQQHRGRTQGAPLRPDTTAV